MGDGNHSLATAKAIWENKKTGLSEEEKQNDPARFAIVELVNIHDDGLVFEPIHRVLFHVDEEALISDMKTYFPTLQISSYPSKAELKQHLVPSTSDTHVFRGISKNGYFMFALPAPKLNLEVGNLQAFLDGYLKASPETKIDYVHGEQVTEELGSKEGNM